MAVIKTVNECLTYQGIISPPVVSVSGWVRSVRHSSKKLGFLHMFDGSCFEDIQIVLTDQTVSLDKSGSQNHWNTINEGSSIKVDGVLKSGKNKALEIEAIITRVLGDIPNAATYPLPKQVLTMEYLRDIPNLRIRTKTFQAIMRIRSSLAQATHLFFGHRHFQWMASPIITSGDCEGAGETFQLAPVRGKEFFKNPAYLTVSGQLEGESYAMSLGKVYTFGPTFRAEDSNTTRHLAEFWMVEPEVAFATLSDIQKLAQDYVMECIKYVLEKNTPELECLGCCRTISGQYYEWNRSGFARITYTEAINLLIEHHESKQQPIFATVPFWGLDLPSEHERWLAEHHFKKPVFVQDYPQQFKAFYMKQNPIDSTIPGPTVASTDLLVPGIGELIGGSQREEDYTKLIQAMESKGLDPNNYKDYLDLRQYGTVPHSGFGLGFERLIRLVTGVANIRDVIPFPRYPGSFQ